MTDYLGFVLDKMQPYSVIVPCLQAAIEQAGTDEVLDLCSGAGGPWRSLVQKLDASLRVRLTDRFPNIPAFEEIRVASDSRIGYETAAVDATAVPENLMGFRTLFSGFHHFTPESARAILEDAVRKGRGIGVFELTQRRPAVIWGMLLVPLIILIVTPAIRPFRWSRLFWTYILPAVPLFAMFDGIVSCLRTYSTAELRTLTSGQDTYTWDIGEESVPGSAAPVTYLIGYPAGP